MNTKTLIRNIENLSATLNQKQLAAFLDIMDAVAAMATESQELSRKDKLASTTPLSSVSKGLH
ncbi:hypothetical protein [Alteromonas lipolytica]|uniref:Uncharacterized protein n=1 Tax=Alteromonas lipolytica TaxID=1856405 RepID=A0A1E8FJG2_9ALTE|nr:hypothetical protein [Alteromonas lipolytica]OFI36070.1 hypothetical protein BFC17_10410 [Alteromonas lipolytica]GGF71215.1 hypothetical protein GCM10011338_24240 [Alteromonas lipolytica]